MTDPTETITLTEPVRGIAAWLPDDFDPATRLDLRELDAQFVRMREDMRVTFTHMQADYYERGAPFYSKSIPEMLAEDARSQMPTGITVAVAAVASTILALEYLRRRKQLVAAEDPQSVIADFVAWFERWIAGLREMFRGSTPP